MNRIINRKLITKTINWNLMPIDVKKERLASFLKKTKNQFKGIKIMNAIS